MLCELQEFNQRLEFAGKWICYIRKDNVADAEKDFDNYNYKHSKVMFLR